MVKLMYKVTVLKEEGPVTTNLFEQKTDALLFVSMMLTMGVKFAQLNKWTWETTIED